MSRMIGTFALVALGSLLIPSGPLAHGVIESPPSRQWLCGNETRPEHFMGGSTPKMPACSTAFAGGANPQAPYQFMAVVTHTWGRAKANPLTKNVCGYDGETWKGAATPWDVPMAWPTQPMTPGRQPITWNISWGPHFDDTKEFRYWITKPNFVFSPTKALTWDDFETEAFCVEEYNDKSPTGNPDVTADKPGNRFVTRCQVPERKGHHVIYGEWGRTEPTIERFHGCIDVGFGMPTALETPKGRTSGALRPAGPAMSIEAADALGRMRNPAAPKAPLAVPAR